MVVKELRLQSKINPPSQENNFFYWGNLKFLYSPPQFEYIAMKSLKQTAHFLGPDLVIPTAI